MKEDFYYHINRVYYHVIRHHTEFSRTWKIFFSILFCGKNLWGCQQIAFMLYQRKSVDLLLGWSLWHLVEMQWLLYKEANRSIKKSKSTWWSPEFQNLFKIKWKVGNQHTQLLCIQMYIQKFDVKRKDIQPIVELCDEVWLSTSISKFPCDLITNNFFGCDWLVAYLSNILAYLYTHVLSIHLFKSVIFYVRDKIKEVITK